MGTRVLDRIDGWEQRRFADGYRGLERLTAEEFSGVVRADGAELFVTRGSGVAVHEGGIDDFEGASGTAYVAPSAALPVLAVMQAQSEEVRDSFYTEQTPLLDVHRTLSTGGFTGYVELSENVLSGDYYLVYHAGKQRTVAYVGQSAQLVHGDRAFQEATDEVGIYEVRPVDIEPLDIPEPEQEQESEHDVSGAATNTSTPDADQTVHTVPSVDPVRTPGETPLEPVPVDDHTAPAETADHRASADTPADPEGAQTQQDRQDGATVESESPEVDRQSEQQSEAVTEAGEQNRSIPEGERLRQRVRELEREQEELRERFDTLQADYERLSAMLDDQGNNTNESGN
jgi:hypothetical protein